MKNGAEVWGKLKKLVVQVRAAPAAENHLDFLQQFTLATERFTGHRRGDHRHVPGDLFAFLRSVDQIENVGIETE